MLQNVYPFPLSDWFEYSKLEAKYLELAHQIDLICRVDWTIDSILPTQYCWIHDLQMASKPEPQRELSLVPPGIN